MNCTLLIYSDEGAAGPRPSGSRVTRSRHRLRMSPRTVGHNSQRHGRNPACHGDPRPAGGLVVILIVKLSTMRLFRTTGELVVPPDGHGLESREERNATKVERNPKN
jgi:hypothetical protein